MIYWTEIHPKLGKTPCQWLEEYGPDYLDDELRAMWEAETGEKIGHSVIPRARDRYKVRLSEKGWVKARMKSQPPTSADIELNSLVEDVVDPVEKERAKVHYVVKQNEYLKRRLKETEAEQSLIADMITANLAKIEPLSIPPFRRAPGRNRWRPQIMTLALSDIHGGQVVKSEDVAGLSEYDWGAVEERMGVLRESIFEIAESMPDIPFNEFWINALGDFVTGEDIFLGQGRRIDRDLIDQTFMLAELVSKELVVPLCQYFPKVRLNGVWGNHGRCLSKDMELLTNNGWKSYNEISIGDIIPTMNLKTGFVEYYPIEAAITYQNEPIMYVGQGATNRGLELTGDHTVIYYDKYRKGYKARPLSDMVKMKDYLGIPKAAKSGNEGISDITEDELVLLGIILTDGSIKTDPRGYKQLCIYQSKKRGIDRIKKLLELLDIPYTLQSRSRKTKVICGRKLVRPPKESLRFYIKSGTARNRLLKLLPTTGIQPWMYNLSDKQIKYLLEGIILGDGNVRVRKTGLKGAIRATKFVVIWGNRSFLDGLQGLLVTHDVPCSLITDKRGATFLSLHSKKHCTVTENIEPAKYNDISWCVTVTNHTIFVRSKRTGKCFIVGNTGKKGSHSQRTNFDYVCYRYLKARTSQIENLELFISESAFMAFDCLGRVHTLMHGDSINRWMQIPYYGVERTHARLIQVLRLFIDYLFIGHHHQAATIDASVGQRIMNGSWTGSDEYSVTKMHAGHQPKQVLCGFNETRGLTFRFDIQLAPRRELVADEHGIYTPVYQMDER